MKTTIVLLLATLLGGAIPATSYAVGDLSADEQATLLHMREEEKLARDVYLEMNDLWSHSVFVNIAASEQRHMDAMLKMVDLYGLTDPVGDNPRGVFEDSYLFGLYNELLLQGAASLADAFHAGAKIEELDMIDLANAIIETDESPLQRSYSNLLAGSCNHLRAFASHIVSLEGSYEPKYLDQKVYEDCIGTIEDGPVSNGGFSINPGLNDAWYYPGTDGQGFAITVYPGLKRVFLLWFTFGLDFADIEEPTLLGDKGQRWLAAEGVFEGSHADLEVYSVSGGLFDDPGTGIERKVIGYMHLHFENCDSGTVEYELLNPEISGMVPIQRINAQNVNRCLREALSD